MNRKSWIKRGFALTGVLMVSLTDWNISAQAAESPVLFQDQAQEQRFFVPGDIKTQIEFGYGKKDLGTITIPGQDVGVRAFFEKFTEGVSWDQKNKVAIVKNKGKTLIIPFSGKVAAQANQVVLPDGWAYLKDGKAFLKYPFFAYVFDRYGEYKSGSEEKQWQQRLGFLNIEYIDTIGYSSKDNIFHTGVTIKEGSLASKD
ncbi:hypothetical protein B9G55_03160 [Saccharibacillus sp. O16]|nr:hypothetical protein B9G55_03160 [Saccharibacillus sp. O16]